MELGTSVLVTIRRLSKLTWLARLSTSLFALLWIPVMITVGIVAHQVRVVAVAISVVAVVVIHANVVTREVDLKQFFNSKQIFIVKI